MKSLDEIQKEFLKYAPSYAQQEAMAAIRKIQEIKAQGVLRDGVYYIVHIDLVGSTEFAGKHGNDAISRRIQIFHTSCISAVSEANIKNIAVFLKEIGDASLFVFQHFPDVLRWKDALDEYLDVWGECGVPYRTRTCVHIGEVSLDGVNPLSLAVSQTFKMDKLGIVDEIVLSNPAYQIAWPTLARAHYAFEECGAINLDGVPYPVGLHKLCVVPETKLTEETHDFS